MLLVLLPRRTVWDLQPFEDVGIVGRRAYVFEDVNGVLRGRVR